MEVIQRIKENLVRDIEEQIREKHWNQQVQEVYPSLVNDFFDWLESILEPIATELLQYQEHQDVVKKVFAYDRDHEKQEVRFRICKTVCTVHPAGENQSHDIPWTMYLEFEGEHDKGYERFYLEKERDDTGAWFWTIMNQMHHVERLKEEHILELLERLFL